MKKYIVLRSSKTSKFELIYDVPRSALIPTLKGFAFHFTENFVNIKSYDVF